MLLFNRIATFKPGNPLDGPAFAIEAASVASNAMGIPVTVFVARFGAPLNQVMWSCRVDSQAQLEAATAKLLADESYLALIPKGTDVIEAAPTDNLSVVVSSTLTPAPKRYYGVTTATIANGKIRQAMDFGVRIQDYVCSETGLAGAFVSSLYASFGGVGWLLGADSLAEMDSYNAMQATDHKFQDLLEEASTLFIEGSGRTQLIEKIN